MEDKVLTIEQMQELIDIGIGTYKASLCWYVLNDTKFIASRTDEVKDMVDEIHPTFTLQDILEIIPKRIELPTYEVYDLQIKPITHDGKWKIDFPNIHSEEGFILNAAFNMLKWCKQNNYI